MPDNFVEGDTLLEAILAVQPSLRGKVDRFGNMMSAHTCASSPRNPYAYYYECVLWLDDDDEEHQRPSPLRERRKSHRAPPIRR